MRQSEQRLIAAALLVIAAGLATALWLNGVAGGAILGVTGALLWTRSRQSRPVPARPAEPEPVPRQRGRRLREVLDSLPDVVWSGCPQSGRILYISGACRTLYGYPPEEFRRRPELWFELIHPDDRASSREYTARLHRDGEVTMEYRIRREDGAVRWVRDTGRAVRDSRGQVVRLDGIVTDITDLKTAEQAAAAASAAKDRLLASVSHELRTPLNAISGMLELLDRGQLSPEQRRDVAAARGATRDLTLLINNLIAYSDASTGPQPLTLAPCSIADSIEAALVGVREVAQAKGLEIELSQPAGAPTHLMADKDRLRTLLHAILSNAVKFTTSGTVRIAVEEATEIGGICQATMVISDTGIGMSPDIVERALADPFFTSGEGSERLRGSAGIGLTLARRLAESMDGQLLVESQPNVGTRVIISLPMTNAPAPAVAPIVARRARVLIVDDNALNRAVAGRLLEGLGAEVKLACDGTEAIEAVHHDGPFDLVLMDCQMPVMDGYTCTRELRLRGAANAFGDRLPIVALTAHSHASDKLMCYEAGMDGYLTKPVTAQALAELLQRHVAQDGRAAL